MDRYSRPTRAPEREQNPRKPKIQSRGSDRFNRFRQNEGKPRTHPSLLQPVSSSRATSSNYGLGDPGTDLCSERPIRCICRGWHQLMGHRGRRAHSGMRWRRVLASADSRATCVSNDCDEWAIASDAASALLRRQIKRPNLSSCLLSTGERRTTVTHFESARGQPCCRDPECPEHGTT